MHKDTILKQSLISNIELEKRSISFFENIINTYKTDNFNHNINMLHTVDNIPYSNFSNSNISNSTSIWINYLNSLPIIIIIKNDNECLWVNDYTIITSGYVKSYWKYLQTDKFNSILFHDIEIHSIFDLFLTNHVINSATHKLINDNIFKLKCNSDKIINLLLYQSKISLSQNIKNNLYVCFAFDITQIYVQIINKLDKYNDIYNSLARIEYSLSEQTKIFNYSLESKANLLKKKNALLKKDIDRKNNDISLIAIILSEKNQFITSLKSMLYFMLHGSNDVLLNNINYLIKQIDERFSSYDIWFSIHEQDNDSRSSAIKEFSMKYPMLSPSELRIFELIKLDVNNNDISIMMNISKRTVEKHIQNIRKKMNLDYNQKLRDN